MAQAEKTNGQAEKQVNALIPHEVAELVAKGKIVFFGEFRRGAAVEFTGKGGRKFHQTKASVESENGTITVTEFLADDVDWTKWVSPFQKGQMVYGVVRGVEESSGVQIVQAKLFAVT